MFCMFQFISKPHLGGLGNLEICSSEIVAAHAFSSQLENRTFQFPPPARWANQAPGSPS